MENDIIKNVAEEAKEMDLNVVEMVPEKKGMKVSKNDILGFVSGVCSAVAARIVAKKIAAKIAAKKNKNKKKEDEEESESEYLTVDDIQNMEEE